MRNFDARLTLVDSAQVFHWKRAGDVYIANVCGRVMTSADDDAFAATYFDDARDYGALTNDCAGFPIALRALELLPGLRVVNQPPWEALVAFILSANNFVSRIRSLVLSVCMEYGVSAAYEGELLYGFPSPEALARADADELRQKTHCGYRAEYLIGSARRVMDGFPLNQLRDMPLKDARKLLVTLPGVGEKVAECVLLFGCGRADAFPVDVWVKRLMADWFSVTGSPAFVRDEAVRLLGPRCGLVQQYLFHAARTGLIDVSRGSGA